MTISDDTTDLTLGPSSTADPPARPSTKRAKPPGKQDGEQGRKRARGRPRLELDPATVADRRRAQLRVAQRAYRDRKEGTLTTLERRVQCLEQKQQNMTSGLANLYDAFLAEGLGSLAPDLTIRLKSLVEQSMTTLERDTPEGTHRSESSGLESQVSTTAASEPPYGATQSDLVNGPLLEQEGSLYSASSTSQDITARMRESTAYMSQGILGRSGFATYKGGDPLAPMPMFFDCIGWTASYAFREKTFGRRMQRAALEAATEMCNQEYPDPDCYTAVFGFCLLWESKDEIRTRILRLVQRPASETLDDWSFPFASLGGTGQLSKMVSLDKVPAGAPGQQGFLPIGNYGTLHSTETKDTFQPKPFMGPFSPSVESARDTYLDQQIHMLFPDFEGHFYDPNDTELYLRLRGIVIPEQVDFVTAEINLDDFSLNDADFQPPTVTSDSCKHNTSKTTNDWRMACIDQGGPENLQALLPDTFLSRVDWAAGAGDSSMFPAPSILPMSPLELDDLTGVKAGAPTGRKVKISIDVNRLVAEIVQHTVCLGRCPGIRPKQINQAVRMAATLQPRP